MYYLLLLKQFNQKTGYKSVCLESSEYLKEFKEWLIALNKESKVYTKVLEEKGIALENGLELYKGAFDTLENSPEQIVSPFAHTLGGKNEGLIVYRGEPLIFTLDSDSIKYRRQATDVYLTHNPYNEEFMKVIENLCTKTYDTPKVCLGMFGSIYDKDKEQNLEMLKSFQEKLNSPVEIEEYITNGFYAYLWDNNGGLRKKLVRTLQKEIPREEEVLENRLSRGR